MPVDFEADTKAYLAEQDKAKKDAAILQAAYLLEQMGFSQPSAAKAAGKIATEDADLANLANLIEYRHTGDSKQAKQFAGEMLNGAGQPGQPYPGWDMYVRPEVSAAEGSKPLAMEDPLINYSLSPEKTQAIKAGSAAERNYNEASAQAGNAYDQRLERAASLRKKILGY